MSALLVINELDDIFGKFLIIRLQTFHHKILESDDFMEFDIEQENLEAAYYYMTS